MSWMVGTGLSPREKPHILEASQEASPCHPSAGAQPALTAPPLQVTAPPAPRPGRISPSALLCLLSCRPAGRGAPRGAGWALGVTDHGRHGWHLSPAETYAQTPAEPAPSLTSCLLPPPS